jgi:uncharacterized membrane protein SpoIIM required for sporulation
MNLQRWINRKEPLWKKLEALLQKIDKQGFKSLSATEVRSLSSLYRTVSADLARARTHQLGQTLTHHLQSLTSRAYSQVYQGSRRQDWQAARDFVMWGFPQVVQETGIYIGLATAMVLLGAIVAWWYAWRDPAFMALVVPESMINLVLKQKQLWMGHILGDEPMASSTIMINNLSVTFRAAAGGITAGLFTSYILIFNGILLGAIGVLVAQGGLAYPFWAFVFPHGSLELPAIFISGGAGLLIAKALLFPGEYRRADAFKRYGLQAAKLMFGVVVLLIFAGIIEAFISPQLWLPAPLKYLLGTVLFSALVAYCGRSQSNPITKNTDAIIET